MAVPVHLTPSLPPQLLERRQSPALPEALQCPLPRDGPRPASAASISPGVPRAACLPPLGLSRWSLGSGPALQPSAQPQALCHSVLLAPWGASPVNWGLLSRMVLIACGGPSPEPGIQWGLEPPLPLWHRLCPCLASTVPSRTGSQAKVPGPLPGSARLSGPCPACRTFALGCLLGLLTVDGLPHTSSGSADFLEWPCSSETPGHSPFLISFLSLSHSLRMAGG